MNEFGEIAHLLYEKGKELAEATAKWEMLSESRKSVIAKLASEQNGSEATRERIARASIDFKKYLGGVKQARQRMLELKYEVDSIKMQFDYYRSMNALKRKESEIL